MDSSRATLTLALVALLVCAVPASAARKPTKQERQAIRSAALDDCKRRQDASPQYPCRWQGGVRVSTSDARYAWAEVSGPHHSNSGILKRRGRRGGGWRVVRVVGGGIQPCTYWRAAAPQNVVHDLRVRGFIEGSGSFEYQRCPRDPLDPRFRGSTFCAESTAFGVSSASNVRVRRGSCRGVQKALAAGTFTSTGEPQIEGFGCLLHKSFEDGAVFRCRRGRTRLQLYVGG